MSEPVPRLGDVIDDYCPRCRLLLNHAVASLVQAKVVKVVCQTCHSEHPYRNGEVPQKKKPSPRNVLFEQVLQKAASAEPDSLRQPRPAQPQMCPRRGKRRGLLPDIFPAARHVLPTKVAEV